MAWQSERGPGPTMLKTGVKPLTWRWDRENGKGPSLKWHQEQLQDDQTTSMHKVNLFASHPEKEQGDSPVSVKAF